MVSRSEIENIGERAVQQRHNLATEEAAKHALVLPFIQAMGYNVFDPTEVVPEFTADYGIKSGEKVDYALMRDAAPVLLIECKKVGDPLDSGRASQLARYFTNTPARIAILTDGIVYKFFSDLDAENAMDAMPFLEIDVTKVNQRDVQALGNFTKHSFNLDEARSVASNMKHTTGMKIYLSEMYDQPDEEFVRLLARKVFTGSLVQSRIEHFSGLAKLAFNGFVNDLISNTLQRASDMVNKDDVSQTQEEEEDGLDDDVGAAEEDGLDDDAASEGPRGIVTTVEEIQGYELVKTIVSDCVSPERVYIRDTRSYCGILLDNNERKPISRLRFTSSRKRIGLLGNERDSGGRRIETQYRIETVNEIADYAEQLREVVRGYLQETNDTADREGQAG